MNATERDIPLDEGACWYYETPGKCLGPVPDEEIVRLIGTQRLPPGQRIWRPGLPCWVPVEQSEFRPHLGEAVGEALGAAGAFAADAPADSEADADDGGANNTLAWLLAFAPVMGVSLEGFVAYLVYRDPYLSQRAVQSGAFFFLTVAFNVLIAFVDERWLWRAGHDTAGFRGWVWLAPVYLYRRARQLGQNLGPLAAWVACLFVVLTL
ncbi:GYF domain-containing protein [Acidovorax sp. SUPP3334]|uniref:GYF domain-containing protein n=1 Tax=Acidovorax sp. SUPP3334 TaxID=2920881 RepID=UPI0023DE1B71|nr:GYF domain-containing protein [Acidovorax sp. SUPP3334]GKT24282.1 GYF domain-containing protein [Acidovorax sp. SUPP3334]